MAEAIWPRQQLQQRLPAEGQAARSEIAPELARSRYVSYAQFATAVFPGMLLASTLAFSSTGSKATLHDLHYRILHLKAELKSQTKLRERVAEVKSLRKYVTRELDHQHDVMNPDPQDDQLALTLIGLDEDLGSFMDNPIPDFSASKCAGYRIALIHSYSGAGAEDRVPANLPTHTMDSLDLLDLLCRS